MKDIWYSTSTDFDSIYGVYDYYVYCLYKEEYDY